MEFLNPSAIYGLLALLVPTIVLLLSKQKQNVVNFPSLRFLSESESKSAKSIFPTQWLLWFLRVAIISLLVVLLARPIFKANKHDKKVYVEKDIFDDEAFASVLSTLGSDVEAVDPESLWILAERLNSSKDSSIIYTRNYAKNFKGKPVDIASHVSWMIVPNALPSTLLDTVLINNETIGVKTVSGEQGLTWTSEKLEKNDIVAENPTTIKVISSVQSKNRKEDLMSILAAYQKVLPLAVTFEEKSAEWLIAIDTQVVNDGLKLFQWDYLEGPLNLKHISTDFVRMQGELSTETLERSDFALQLAHILLANKMHLDSLDRRVDPAPKQKIGEEHQAAMVKSERKYYWWSIILILILIERWYSRKLAGA